MGTCRRWRRILRLMRQIVRLLTWRQRMITIATGCTHFDEFDEFPLSKEINNRKLWFVRLWFVPALCPFVLSVCSMTTAAPERSQLVPGIVKTCLHMWGTNQCVARLHGCTAWHNQCVARHGTNQCVARLPAWHGVASIF